MVHGFYGGMGGFVFEIKDTEKSFFCRDSNQQIPFRVSLTAQGVSLLAKCGRLPTQISQAEIADKSKADSLLLVCVQAG
jgi:hypothetical protein